MKLTILGTGNAVVTECYNTCFILEENHKYFLVDGGGGNTLFRHLKEIGVKWQDIDRIFLTHKHLDHLMGIVWLLRFYCQNMKRNGFAGHVYIYGHEEVTGILEQMAHMLLQPGEWAYIGRQLHLVTVEDGETREILGHKVTFFDVGSTKDKQFGFTMHYGENKKLTCLGDEPYRECEEAYAKDSDWLMHEAFCLYEDREIFDPYKKAHSTAKDAAECAEKLGVKNLILYHTEDRTIATRKERYTAEGSRYFSGQLYVPEDLESFELD